MSRTRERAWLLLPLLLTVALYLPACFGADWIVDDRPLIPDHLRPGQILGEWTTPTHVHAADREGGYLWRPLTSTVYQLVGELFGRTPLPFRGLNLVLHLVNLGLVVAVARRLGADLRAAALLATAWAVHPLLPDVVCWMADTYDLMATTLLLAGLRVALAERGRLAARAAVGAGFFLLALLSKESSLAWLGALPIALLLLRGWRPAVVHGAGLLIVAVLHGRWHAAIVGRFQTSAGDLLAAAPLDFLGLWSDYLRWPLHLPVQAGFTHLVQPGAQPLSWLGLLLLLVGIAAALRGLAGHPRAAAVGAAVAVWSVMLTPGALAALGFGQQSSRYLYLPLTLALPLLGGALPRLPGRRLALALALLAAWCLAWLPRTVPRVGAWASERTLFTDELRAEPANPFAMKALGRLLVADGEVEAGLRLWYGALQQPAPSSFVMDVQQERLDFVQAARHFGLRAPAREQLEVFIAEEARQGRAIDPSVQRLRQELDAAR